jgi:putative hydroxymethylpyrimidine transport system substrate-binding protein
MVIRAVFAALLMLAMVSPAAAADKLVVLLDWFANPNHATLFAAQYINAYKDAGLDVQFVAPADPNTPPRLVAANQADLALSYQPELYLLVEQGLPVIRVATLIDTPLNTLTALGDGSIKSLADFKGRKIGYAVSGVEDSLATAMLASAGLKRDDVVMTNVNMQLVTALLSHVVDGVVGAYRNFEVIDLQSRGAKPLAFYPEEHGVPPYDELIVIANAARVNDPKFVRFFGAVEKGTIYLLNHPDEMWADFAKEHPDLDNALNKTSWFATLPRFDKRPLALDRRRYETFASFMLSQALIKHQAALASYAAELTP